MALKNLDLLLEAERRGLLPPERQQLLDEARRRGLAPEAPPPASVAGEPEMTRLPGGGVMVPLPPRSRAEAETRALTMGVEAPGAPGATRHGFSRQLLQNILSTPDVLAKAFYQAFSPQPFGLGRGERLDPISAVGAGLDLATGGGVDPAGAAGRVREDLAGGGRLVETPSAAEALAAGDAALQMPAAALRGEALEPGLRYDQALEAEQRRDIRYGETQPAAVASGETLGDVASLMLGRTGGRAALTGRTLPAAGLPGAAPLTAETILGRVVQATGRSLRSGGGRALEAGAEGAFLAALNDADPETVGAAAAGVQTAGDLARPTFKYLMKGNNLLKAIGLGTVASLGLQQLTPGGLDRLLPTLEDKNKEAILALLLTGSASALTGRIPPRLAGPAFAEIASTVPRGTLMSVLTAVTKDPRRIGPVLARFTEDPDYFGPKAKRMLTRALTVEGANLAVTVDSLFSDRAFRRNFEALEAQ